MQQRSRFNLKNHAKEAKMHVQFQNSCKKRQKCIFNYKVHKKAKKTHLFWNLFAFITRMPMICIFNLKIHTKKDKKKISKR